MALWILGHVPWLALGALAGLGLFFLLLFWFSVAPANNLATLLLTVAFLGSPLLAFLHDLRRFDRDPDADIRGSLRTTVIALGLVLTPVALALFTFNR